MKKAIVTGANGFVGSALTQELVNNGIEVIALDRGGCFENIPKSDKVVFVPFDLAYLSDITPKLLEYEPDLYFHLAWLGMNGSTRGDAAVQFRNTAWALDALKQASEINCKRFVCAGSIMEYETYYAVMKQGNRPGESYIYGAAKFAAHSICMIEASKLNIEIVWAEITNAYGAGENSPRFINSTLRKIAAGEPLEFTAGTQNYDFVYIDDVARALRLIGEKGHPFNHYLIGSSNAKPLKEFVLEIKNAIAPDKEFVFGDVPYTGVNLPIETFDCSLTEKDTGFKAKISFTDGIKRTSEWLRTIGLQYL